MRCEGALPREPRSPVTVRWLRCEGALAPEPRSLVTWGWVPAPRHQVSRVDAGAPRTSTTEPPGFEARRWRSSHLNHRATRFRGSSPALLAPHPPSHQARRCRSSHSTTDERVGLEPRLLVEVLAGRPDEVEAGRRYQLPLRVRTRRTPELLGARQVHRWEVEGVAGHLLRRTEEHHGPAQRHRAAAADPRQCALDHPAALAHARRLGQGGCHDACRSLDLPRDQAPSSWIRDGRSESDLRLRGRDDVGGSGWSLEVQPFGSESLMIVRSAWPYCLWSGPVV